MLFKHQSRAFIRPVTGVSFFICIALAGSVKANDPELFVPDPNLLDDHVISLPRTGSSGGFNYEIIQGFAVMEGDILLGQVSNDGTLPVHTRPRGLGRSDAFGRWPDGIVPYTLPTTNSGLQRQRIELAIQHWSDETNISFVERNAENQANYPNYIRFDSSNSCASYVGMQGGGQSILISDACSTGSIIHEIGHALGLFHEHTRPDRDNFAQVNWDQVVPGKEINFDILDAGVRDYGDYDYGSIMHYGEYFFSSTGEPTIVVPDGISIGQRQGLSDQDIQSVNDMYATDLALLQPTINAVDDGVEIGISIANQGQLGAHKLELLAIVDENTSWQGISPDSGWDCSITEFELQCTRPTLTEQSESQFTLLIDSLSLADEDISLVLSSRTSDTDLTNNRFNDTIAEFESEVIDIELPSVITAPPEIQAAKPVNVSEMGNTEAPPVQAALPVSLPVAKASTGAGSDNGVLASLLGLALVWHRRRVRKDTDPANEVIT